MIRKPSLQTTYDCFYSGDPAIIQLSTEPKPTDAQIKEHSHKLDRARETGDWSGVQCGEPTRFQMRILPGNALRYLQDLLFSDKLGTMSAAQLFFRAACTGIVNGPDIEVKVSVDQQHPQLGPIAHIDVSNALDAIDPKIVQELGFEALTRSQGPRPKP